MKNILTIFSILIIMLTLSFLGCELSSEGFESTSEEQIDNPSITNRSSGNFYESESNNSLSLADGTVYPNAVINGDLKDSTDYFRLSLSGSCKYTFYLDAPSYYISGTLYDFQERRVTSISYRNTYTYTPAYTGIYYLLINGYVGNTAYTMTINSTQCGSESETVKINDHIFGLSKPTLSSEARDPVGGKTYDVINGGFLCDKQTYSERKNFSEFVILNDQIDEVWAGMILNTASAMQSTLQPITLPRSTLDLSISLANAANTNTVTIKDVESSLGGYRTGLQKLRNANLTSSTESRLNYQIESISSEEQIEFSTDLNITQADKARIEGMFNFNSNTLKTKLLVSFTQQYYSVSINRKSFPSQYFASTITYDQLSGSTKIPASSYSPVYVSTINYGRIAFLSIESSLSESQVKADLNAAFQQAKTSASINMNYLQKVRMSTYTMNIFVWGGNSEDGVYSIKGFDAFTNYILNAHSYSATNVGSPISYHTYYLKDDSQFLSSKVGSYPVYTDLKTIPANIRIENIQVVRTDNRNKTPKREGQIFAVLTKSSATPSFWDKIDSISWDDDTNHTETPNKDFPITASSLKQYYLHVKADFNFAGGVSLLGRYNYTKQKCIRVFDLIDDGYSGETGDGYFGWEFVVPGGAGGDYTWNVKFNLKPIN
ncbi:MAG: thiol-activated cytolysin family protein [Spirochaetales bacterium]|nr:thiol-activated cytolysin family protein [Spirochaetales bacterium]